MTKNANLIMDIINASYDHLTAEQIYFQLKNENVKISMATVYNSLSYLCENGLIRKVPMEGFADRYDRVKRHDHLVCRNCSKLMDISLKDLTESLQKDVNVPILSYELKISCICEDCSKKKGEIEKCQE